MAQGQLHSEGVGHLSRPALTCTHTGSYLTLPAVDLEALKAEFQDDSPASGTILGRRELDGRRHYLPGPALSRPASASVTTGWSANPSPAAKGLSGGCLKSWGSVDGSWQTTPRRAMSWPCYDHPPHVPSMASTHGTQVMTAQGKGSPGIRDTAVGAWVWPSLGPLLRMALVSPLPGPHLLHL